MGLYATYVFPALLDWAMRQKPIRRQREKIVPRARGQVLEIGVGSGLNLPHYDRTRVAKLYALDPALGLQQLARQRAAATELPIEFLPVSGEAIPLPEDSIDSIVVTYTLCTIPDVAAALAEMRRVLRPSGTLLFSEHGRAPDADVARWQDRLNPLWRRLAGGCNLNRRIPELLEAAGFTLPELSTLYLPGPRLLTFNYWGAAVRS
ncbi:MAG: SAM-dependent methyltransferase [Polyangiaceae bacterium UTPRO1]|nr:methyltransferase domain-containing protein [Myxococcales bacterium]OQY66897.1 MAG: SAM-dependent methyltransferase [Polyangiaceae bacterium UTPRO1]